MNSTIPDDDTQTPTSEVHDFVRLGLPPEANNMDSNKFNSIVDARPILPNVSFFMGDLRDGLAMVSFANMQKLNFLLISM